MEPLRRGAQVTVPGLPPVEDVVEDAGAAGLGQELGAEADETAGGDAIVEAHPPGTVVDHLEHGPLAQGEQLGHDAEILVGHVDADALHRLVHLAVDLSRHDLRLADRELEALASHRLDQHGELQLAAAEDLPHVGPLGRPDADGDVPDQLGVEPRLEQAGRHLVAVQTGQRRGVDADGHGQTGLVDGDGGERHGAVGVGQRLADGHLGQAGHGDDLARAGLVGRDLVERFGHVQLGDLGPLHRASRRHQPIVSPLRRVPLCTRHTARRPT